MKKRLFFLLVVLLTASSLLAQYAALRTTPYSDIMSSGSTYVSAPQTIGAGSPEPMYQTATAPSYAPAGPRRDPVYDGPPVDDDDDYDPNNPQWSPLSDANWFLLLLLALYAACTGYMRYRRESKKRPS